MIGKLWPDTVAIVDVGALHVWAMPYGWGGVSRISARVKKQALAFVPPLLRYVYTVYTYLYIYTCIWHLILCVSYKPWMTNQSRIKDWRLKAWEKLLQSTGLPLPNFNPALKKFFWCLQFSIFNPNFFLWNVFKCLETHLEEHFHKYKNI